MITPGTLPFHNRVHILCILWLPTLVKSSAVHTQSTVDLSSGWQSTNCGRGTTDVLWSCLATILLCVWTVIHLPTGEYDMKRAATWRGKIVRSRLATAIIGLFVPEYIAMRAIGDWEGASRIVKSASEEGYSRITRTHAFALDMGAFCVQLSNDKYYQINREQFKPHDFAAQELDQLDFGCSADQIDRNMLEKINQTPVDEIKSLANSDSLAKLVACTQSLWLVAQVVARVVQHIAVTPLEVATTAYVASALISYILWWQKPQNVAIPIVLKGCENSVAKQSWSDSHFNHVRDTWLEFLWAGNAVTREGKTSYKGLQFLSKRITFSTCVFAAIHLASWNVFLPSPVEQWSWRASALGCIVLPIAVVLIAVNPFRKNAHSSFGPFAYIFFVLYGIVRVFMLIEIFISLRLQPASAYSSVEWSNFLPHI